MKMEPIKDAIAKMSKDELEGARIAHGIARLSAEDLTALMVRERELGVKP